MNSIITRIIARLEDARGQALAEYGLILGLIGVACLVAMSLLGVALGDKLGEVREALNIPA
jgi:Flp pilus assembly pilin Flp